MDQNRSTNARILKLLLIPVAALLVLIALAALFSSDPEANTPAPKAPSDVAQEAAKSCNLTTEIRVWPNGKVLVVGAHGDTAAARCVDDKLDSRWTRTDAPMGTAFDIKG